MYFQKVLEMYPDMDIHSLASAFTIFGDWLRDCASAAEKSFTAKKKLISTKQLVFDNQTLLSDDDSSYGSCASYVQKKPKKLNIDDDDMKFITSLPSCYEMFSAFDSNHVLLVTVHLYLAINVDV